MDWIFVWEFYEIRINLGCMVYGKYCIEGIEFCIVIIFIVFDDFNEFLSVL